MGRLRHLPPLLLCLPVLISALTTKEKKLIIEKHNDYRSQPDPPATNIKALSWDSSLEDLAASYAKRCIWEHNEERGFRGENLFLMSGSALDVVLGLADWHSERDFYNFTDNSCLEGKMCGHYTQMLWADTERVGCGEHFCEKMEGFEDGNMFLLVCNYEPPGNFQGKKPYKRGDPCTECPETHSCKGSLCVDVDREQKESSTDSPDTTSEPALATVTELAPYTIELAPYTIELTPYTIEPPQAASEPPPPQAASEPPPPQAASEPPPPQAASEPPPPQAASEPPPQAASEPPPPQAASEPPPPQAASEPVPDATLVLISEIQSEIKVFEGITTAMTEPGMTPPPLPTKSSPPVPIITITSVPDTPTSPAESVTIPDQILDVTPSSPIYSSIGSPQTPQESVPPTSLDHGAHYSDLNTQPTRIHRYTASPLTSTKRSGDQTDPPKRSGDQTDPLKTESIDSVPSLQITGDQTFSNDGPDVDGFHSKSSPPPQDPLEEGVWTDKDQPKDLPVLTTPKPLQLPGSPSKEWNKSRKDKKIPHSDPKTNPEREKIKPKSPIHGKLKPSIYTRGGTWSYKTSQSVDEARHKPSTTTTTARPTTIHTDVVTIRPALSPKDLISNIASFFWPKWF